MNRSHGGLPPVPADTRLDFSANINPAGAPAWLRECIAGTIDRLDRYPDPDAAELRRAAAETDGIGTGNILAGNGASELLYALCGAFSDRTALIPVPSYDDYRDAAAAASMRVELTAMNDTGDPETAFRPDFDRIGRAARELTAAGEKPLLLLGAPNNPTGILPDRSALTGFIERNPDVLVVLDESFLDFCIGWSSFRHTPRPNLLILRSLTKFFAIPGLRLGLLYGAAGLLERVATRMPAWSVNTPAQAVGIRALADADFAAESRSLLPPLREELRACLSLIPGSTVFPGAANFLLCRFDTDPGAQRLADHLRNQGIVVRRCGSFRGLDGRYLRFAVRPRPELSLLREALDPFLPSRPGPVRPARGRVLMIQGTASNAGKSLVAAALCRIFRRRGVKVAPFKAQNMALNSWVTPDGGEIGRAQALQAAAAGIEPDTRMNPVLLKPSSDRSSQIVELGRPVGTYAAVDYYRWKDRLWGSVTRSLDSLREEYELVIIEGAGSPGEVNLRAGDIVNMAVALYADAPVLLVGDIDRGGTFAAFVGTLEVLSRRERELVRGFLVNKFRGDPALLKEAYDYMLDRTGIPVLGTLPYIGDHGLPEEDSVSFKESLIGMRRATKGLRVGFFDLPHISNFTDLDPLKGIPGVDLVPILADSSREELFACDALIIPGSKNVAADLSALESAGLVILLNEYLRERRGLVLGICGGLQMLGREIRDPDGLESGPVSRTGIGIFPYSTRLAAEKQTRRRRARIEGSSALLDGYEIHHGRTDWGDIPVLLNDPEAPPEEAVLGVSHPELPCWATYLHGLFENRSFTEAFLAETLRSAGLDSGKLPPIEEYDLDARIDAFADRIEAELDMEAIAAIAGIRAARR